MKPSPDLSLQPGWAHLVSSLSKTVKVRCGGRVQNVTEFRVDRTTAAGTVMGWVDLPMAGQIASGLCSSHKAGCLVAKNAKMGKEIGGGGELEVVPSLLRFGVGREQGDIMIYFLFSGNPQDSEVNQDCCG